MPYFVYYHRHLLILAEIAMNYAEEVLLGGPDKLPREVYEKFRKEFDAVFEKYRGVVSRYRQEEKITGNLPAVAMHYWDPSDYTQNIEIPQELSEHIPDEIDVLCMAMHKHYTWNFNFATRWFGDQGYLPKGFETNGFFSSEPAAYNEQQQEIISGRLNPRSSDPKKFFSNSMSRWGELLIGDTASDINSNKNYKSLVETRSTIPLCTLSQPELDTLFGSATKNLHYINPAERRSLPSSLRTRAYTYNKALPHFQYAFSLFK